MKMDKSRFRLDKIQEHEKFPMEESKSFNLPILEDLSLNPSKASSAWVSLKKNSFLFSDERY
jgi:hypothetical protein